MQFCNFATCNQRCQPCRLQNRKNIPEIIITEYPTGFLTRNLASFCINYHKKYGIFQKHNGNIWHLNLLKMAWHQLQQVLWL